MLIFNLFLTIIALLIDSSHHRLLPRIIVVPTLKPSYLTTRSMNAWCVVACRSRLWRHLAIMPRRPSPQHGEVQESGPDARHRYDESGTDTTYDSLSCPPTTGQRLNLGYSTLFSATVGTTSKKRVTQGCHLSSVSIRERRKRFQASRVDDRRSSGSNGPATTTTMTTTAVGMIACIQTPVKFYCKLLQ